MIKLPKLTKGPPRIYSKDVTNTTVPADNKQTTEANNYRKPKKRKKDKIKKLSVDLPTLATRRLVYYDREFWANRKRKIDLILSREFKVETKQRQFSKTDNKNGDVVEYLSLKGRGNMGDSLNESTTAEGELGYTTSSQMSSPLAGFKTDVTTGPLTPRPILKKRHLMPLPEIRRGNQDCEPVEMYCKSSPEFATVFHDLHGEKQSKLQFT